MDQRTELSEFLRSRRARLRPEDVGLTPYGGRRRVPGLRREELAQLAGVSVAYYTRLEQGHGQNVSASVLEAIAGALRLSETERDHLGRLVRPVPSRSRAARPQRVRPTLQQLLDTMEGVPAYVLGRRTDVIAWNRLACALLGDFPAVPPQRRNMIRQLFLDPAARELYVEWEAKAADLVACLRLEAGRHPDDPQLAALVGELSVKSEEFRRLWAAHNVRDKGHGVKRLLHPLVGELTVACETFVLPADPDQVLVTYHAEPGSPSAESLRLLASWTLEAAPAEHSASVTRPGA
ncbi:MULTISPECIES: helix-turn-helix domain-containing protein [Streptomyces]|uniref:Helix-turn-helix domain-containing protein n=3 Tax=Streptomyces TaxID=1883 RepID=A0A3S9PQM0_STRLT|nr:helix-turn-helix transcriptional regulator [Streptomyces luteoverticillatus]AZQ74712.1 helix-turn-helix domain-containing protein [Streptomyces luteoverticillatus]